MKILILSDAFPPFNVGGADIIAFRSAKGLQAAGHDVHVISTCRDRRQAGWREVDGLPVLFIFCRYNLKWRGWVGLYNRPILRVLKQQIIELKPDVVHAHVVHVYFSYAVLKLSKKYCPKVFLSAHDVDLFHYEKFYSYIDKNNLSIPEKFNYRPNIFDRLRQIKQTRNPWRNAIIKHYLKSVDRIFPVSQALAEAFRQNGIKNTTVVYNGIEPGENIPGPRDLISEKYNLEKDTRIIFLANRFNSLKGGGLLLDYVKEMRRSFSNFIFVIASQENSCSQKVIQQAEQEKLSQYLFFTGWLEPKDLCLWYCASDLCLVPSICFDSFPNNNLEAMSFKKPVIGTCFGGTPEAVLDKVTGYIINPFDIISVSKRIIDLLVDRDKAEHFGQAGYRRILSEFSLARQTDDFINNFNKV